MEVVNRLTEDVWGIFLHVEGEGWEEVTSETTRKMGHTNLKAYRENDPSNTYKIKKYRERVWHFVDKVEPRRLPSREDDKAYGIHSRGIVVRANKLKD